MHDGVQDLAVAQGNLDGPGKADQQRCSDQLTCTIDELFFKQATLSNIIFGDLISTKISIFYIF